MYVQMYNLQVDDTVSVWAVRQCRHTGWTAVSVQLVTDEWDTVRDVYETSGVITNVTANNSGSVNHKYNFTSTACKVGYF